MAGYLSKEVEYVPWVSALNGLSYINTMLKRTSAYGEFKKSVVSFNEHKLGISYTIKLSERIIHFISNAELIYFRNRITYYTDLQSGRAEYLSISSNTLKRFKSLIRYLVLPLLANISW